MKPLEIQTDPRLLENWNAFRGQRVGYGDASLLRPEVAKKIIDPFTPGWGEPFKDIARRMTSFVHEKVREYPDQSLLVVSHEIPIATLRQVEEKKHLWTIPRHAGVELASVTEMAIDSRDELVGIRHIDAAKDVA